MDCIFGAPSITPEELFGQLKALAKQLKADATFKERTTAINELLHKLGKERGCELYYKNLPDHSEFLLDFVWREKANGKQRTALGLESEWGNPQHHLSGNFDKIAAEVEADFSKLLSYKAPLKAMVYTSEANAELQGKVQQRVGALIAEFNQHVAGEVYLLIDFRPGGRCSGCKYTINKSGPQDAPVEVNAVVEDWLDNTGRTSPGSGHKG